MFYFVVPNEKNIYTELPLHDTASLARAFRLQNQMPKSAAAVGGYLVDGFTRGSRPFRAPPGIDSRAQPGPTLAVRDVSGAVVARREAKECPRGVGSAVRGGFRRRKGMSRIAAGTGLVTTLFLFCLPLGESDPTINPSEYCTPETAVGAVLQKSKKEKFWSMYREGCVGGSIGQTYTDRKVYCAFFCDE